MMPQPPRRTGFFEYYEELIGTWTRRLRNRQQAEDLAHDTFVRVLEARSTEVEQPRAYVHQTARNIAVDAHRREDRREALALETFDLRSPHSGDPEHVMHAIQLADLHRAGAGRVAAQLSQDFHLAENRRPHPAGNRRTPGVVQEHGGKYTDPHPAASA